MTQRRACVQSVRARFFAAALILASSVVASADEPTVLRGHVLLPDGKSAAGAGIYWVQFKAPPPRKPEDIVFEKRAAADGEGRFEFSLMGHDAPLEKMPRPLLAYLQGYGVDWVEIVQDEAPQDAVLRLVEDNPIRGRVTNTEGQRVAGAKVTVRIIADSASGSLDGFLAAWKQRPSNARMSLERQCYAARLLPQFTTVTDAEGRFELSGVGAERHASVNISAPGLVSEDLEIVNRAGFDAEQFNKAAQAGMLPQMPMARRFSGLTGSIFEHVAETELMIRGTVFTGPNRKPVVRALVSAQGRGLNNPISVQTDDAGRFELRGVPRSQNAGLSVHTPNSNLLFRSLQPDLAPGQTVVDVEIEMREGVFVEGRVFDQSTGRGVKSRVQFVPLPGNKYAEQPRPAVMQMAGNLTDDDGQFRMLVMPGIGVLMAQVQPGLQGRLGRPPLGAIQPVTYRQASFSEEDSKRAAVTGGDDDRHFTDVYNQLRFLMGINAVKIVDLAPGREPATCDLPLDPGKTKTIAIEDEQGHPVTDAIVGGVADSGPITFKMAEPTCTIYGLGADRPRYVCILHPERRLATSFMMTGDEPGPVTVRLGAVASIAGRALDPDGEPLADAIVQINYQRRSVSDLFFFVTRGQTLKTAADGRFRVENLLPGERLALSFRQGDTFYIGPRITTEQRQLEAGQKLELGDVKVKLPQ
jgi:hypothetical protein